MQILSIHLKNIKSHRELDLSFSRGINVLSGPNGVGKSTIFEAIGYAMFGVDAQSFIGNVDRFVSIGAKKGEIAIIFEPNNDERYRVSRTVGTPAKWLLAKESGGAFEVEEHKDIRETEARLKELLGLEGTRALSEQFELVIGPFQHDFLGPFVIKQPTKRREKFDEILGIDSWRKTFTETKTLASTIKSKIETLRSTIEPLKDQLAVLPNRRADLKHTKTSLTETQLLLNEQQKQLSDTVALLVEFDKRELCLKALESEIDTFRVRIENGKEKIDNQKRLIVEAEKSQKIINETTAGKLAFEEVEKHLITLRDQAKTQRLLEQEVSLLERNANALKERLEADIHAIDHQQKEIAGEEEALTAKRKALSIDDSLRSQAANLPAIQKAVAETRDRLGQIAGQRTGLTEGEEKLAEGVCPYLQEPCINIAERPLGDLFSDKFSLLENESMRLNDELARLSSEETGATTAQTRINALQTQLASLDDQIIHLGKKSIANRDRSAGLNQRQSEEQAARQQLTIKQAELKVYDQLQTQIDAADVDKAKHQQARDLYVANRDQAARHGERKSELQHFEQFLLKLQEEITEKETELNTTRKEYDSGQHQRLSGQKDSLGHDIGALGQKVEGLNVEMRRLSAEIDTLKIIEKDTADKQSQIKNYGEKEELVKFLRNRIFNQVSKHLSERFREEISQRANQIYRIIAEVDEELSWGDDYNIVLSDMVDGTLRERANDQLSGGQTMSAVVALRLALLQTIGARIAFFDEPTSNLDATRRENLAHAFRAIDVGKEEVTEHWYDQLFLISHDVAFTEVTDQIISLDQER